jgi:O-antigen/teichoic acid export membrane protein
VSGDLSAARMSGDPTAGNLHACVTRGLAWKAASSSVLQLAKIIVAVILAHLLSPHDYGVAGMVIVFSSLVMIFSDLAFGSALIHRPIVTEEDRSTVFWTSALVGLVLMLSGIAMSGFVADFYREPAVRPLFAAMSVSFFVASIASTQAALLTREMNFRSLELRQMVAALVSGAVGITLAANGFGPWAIIMQQIAVVTASSALLWRVSNWRPRLKYSRTSLRNLGGYSGNVFGSRLLFYGNRNADNLLVGRFLGASALGAYSVAYNLMLLPISQIAIPVQDVLFPAFSRMQHDVEALKQVWFRANRVIAALALPTLAGLIVVTPDFVEVVLGRRWLAAVPVIQILAVVGMLQSVQGLNSSVLRAVDQTSALFRYSVVVLVASVTAFAVGLRWGIVGVATAYAISSAIVEPYYSRLTAHSVGVTLWGFVRPLLGVAQAVAGMALCVYVARRLALQVGVPVIPRFIMCVALGFAVYVPLCAWRAPEVRAEIQDVRRRRKLAAATMMVDEKPTAVVRRADATVEAPAHAPVGS